MGKKQFQYLDANLVGSTYTPEELVTKLYVENEYLFATRNPQNFGEFFPKLSRKEVDSSLKYAYLHQYLNVRSKTPNGKKHLVITNEYPDVGREYANGFVHRRVKNYVAAGLDVDVVRFGKRVNSGVYEYEGVNVLSGYVNELRGILASVEYDSISVHFLNAEMWKVLGSFVQDTRVYVYIHGFEADNWIRRPFQYGDRASLEAHLKRWFLIKDFWKSIVTPESGIDAFIFVSSWWRKAISDDLNLSFDRVKTYVIHNVIDQGVFHFRPKDPDQRFKVLWVRSAHTAKYGADIAVEILEHLRSSSVWHALDIRIIGDGEHFALFEDSFGDDRNVSIERRFVSQTEMAELHRQYGFFLVPTRYDSQGVARDEAMSSGLIPVTNSVACVPEFVDQSCAVLGGLDEAKRMADDMRSIMEDPDRFLTLSSNAAERAALQCGQRNTTNVEVALMKDGKV